MKSLFAIATASLLITSTAFASIVTQESQSNFTTATYQSKAEAYNAGFDIVNNLKTMSDKELRKEFSLYGEKFVKNITINDAEVTISEFATTPDNIQYKALVNVDFNYSADESDDN
jgi:hypothetical protein